MYDWRTGGTVRTENQAQEPGWKGWKQVLLETKTYHTHTHTSKKKWQHTEISNLKRFEQMELPAKLLDWFLWSNKNNINQSALAQRLLLLLVAQCAPTPRLTPFLVTGVSTKHFIDTMSFAYQLFIVSTGSSTYAANSSQSNASLTCM